MKVVTLPGYNPPMPGTLVACNSFIYFWSTLADSSKRLPVPPTHTIPTTQQPESNPHAGQIKIASGYGLHWTPRPREETAVFRKGVKARSYQWQVGWHVLPLSLLLALMYSFRARILHTKECAAVHNHQNLLRNK